MKNILVLCTGNSCRSQMAEGYLTHFTKGNANIFSAGIETHGVNPKAIAIMKLDGIDISKNTSNLVSEYDNVDFDYIITVCDHAQENCPFIPSKNAKRIHQNFADPSKVKGSEEQIFNAFKKTRTQIKAFCEAFVAEELGF
jgi:arsenate reductase